MTVQQVAVLSNPGSTQNRRRLKKLRGIFERSQNIFHYELDHVHSIPEALRAFSRTSPALLVINGGDGTVQATLSSIVRDQPFERVPPIAILPSGKANMIADDLGLTGKPEKVFLEALAMARSDDFPAHLVDRHLIEMDLGDGSKTRFGMFFGAAGVVNGIRFCRDHIYPLSLPNFLSHLLAIIILAGSALTGGRKEGSATYSSEMRVVMPAGGILEGRYFAVVVTTLDRLLLGIRPYGLDGSGKLGFSATEHRPRAIINAVRGLLRGNFGRTTRAGISTRRVNEVRISGSDPVTLDGEVYEIKPGQTVTLKGDHKLSFLSLRANP